MAIGCELRRDIFHVVRGDIFREKNPIKTLIYKMCEREREKVDEAKTSLYNYDDMNSIHYTNSYL
jgi:hypothetical protein